MGQAQSQTLGQSEVNMEQLNLFGVALTSQEESELAEEQSTTREKEHRRRFVSDLLEVLHQVDNDHEMSGLGGIQDFEAPKSLYNFDPYGRLGDSEGDSLGAIDS